MIKTSVGIFGGTFDPIHAGHIEIAQAVIAQFQLDCVELIPCFQPPHRATPAADALSRVEMTKLAVQNHKNLHVNEIEIQRKGISYTYDTLLQLRHDMPTAIFYYIVGSDAFAQLETWHHWQKLLELTHWIVVSRHHTEMKIYHTKTQIHPFKIQPIPFSATQIRHAIKMHDTLIPGLPELVQEYIIKNHLYEN